MADNLQSGHVDSRARGGYGTGNLAQDVTVAMSKQRRDLRFGAPRIAPFKRKLRALVYSLPLGAALLAGGGYLASANHGPDDGPRLATLELPTQPPDDGQPYIAPPVGASLAPLGASPADAWSAVVVEPGETLSRLFSRLGLPREDWLALSNLPKYGKTISSLRAGEHLELLLDEAGRFIGLRRELDPIHTLQVSKTATGFAAQVDAAQVRREQRIARGTIDSSLYAAGSRAGLPDQTTMKIANIFKWDIDFALDLRSGDHFSVVYEQMLAEDRQVGTGDVLAASFTTRGHTHQAIRFTHDDGSVAYYTPDGKALRKAFLRTPVEFARISSPFNLRRRHPVLNKIRAHKGVDYAAPHGTPVTAAGDGKVVFRGRKGGYGNVVIIDHGRQYSTLYAHLSRFAPGLKLGERVKQGELIGAVGSTGLATGPHLHYEFRVNGEHRDPLKITFSIAERLRGKEKSRFDRQAAPLIAQLDVPGSVQVAARQP